ncbi:MAG: hypothetical protein U5Q03_18790 [Bacteroidota bacterium]|nr:hypothetical protein [Bacteroidota bacterium]
MYANNTFFESFDVSNMLFGGYTNDCFPVLALNDEIHTITYYDNYQCLENSINAGGYTFKNVELDFLYGKDTDIKGKVAAFANTVIGQSDIDIADNYLLTINQQKLRKSCQ